MTNKKNLFLLFFAIDFLILILVLSEYTNHTLSRFYDDWILDNKNHYLSCEELPSLIEVDQTVQAHRAEVERLITTISQRYEVQGSKLLWQREGNIGRVSDGEVFHVQFVWDIAEGCEGSASGEITIFYMSHADRESIESAFGETFFGTPYKLRNI